MSGKPGRSGTNKNQDKPFRDALMIEILEAQDNGPKAVRRLARRLIEKAMTGDVQAILGIADRTDGKPHQSTSLTGEDGTGPVKLVIEIIDAAKRNPE